MCGGGKKSAPPPPPPPPVPAEPPKVPGEVPMSGQMGGGSGGSYAETRRKRGRASTIKSGLLGDAQTTGGNLLGG